MADPVTFSFNDVVTTTEGEYIKLKHLSNAQLISSVAEVILNNAYPDNNNVSAEEVYRSRDIILNSAIKASGYVIAPTVDENVRLYKKGELRKIAKALFDKPTEDQKAECQIALNLIYRVFTPFKDLDILDIFFPIGGIYPCVKISKKKGVMVVGKTKNRFTFPKSRACLKTASMGQMEP